MVLKITGIFALFFALQTQAFGQTEKYVDLAYGEWIFETEDENFYGRLLLMDDGTFEMASNSSDSEELETGSYTVEGDKLTLKFDDGTQQVNEIEKLTEAALQFRFIETVYTYKRATP